MCKPDCEYALGPLSIEVGNVVVRKSEKRTIDVVLLCSRDDEVEGRRTIEGFEVLLFFRN